MARQPEPRKWLARKGWYARVRGRRLRLASLGEGKAVAWERLRALLAEGATDGVTVLDVFAAHFRKLRQRVDDGSLTPKAFRVANHLVGDFPDRFGALRAVELKPHMLGDYLAAHPTWGPTTRADAAAAVRAAFRGAVADGRIDRDPLASFRPPRRRDKRAGVLTAGEVARVRGAVTYDAFRELFDFLMQTGCRPGEAVRITAADLREPEGVVVLAEHKTAHATGRPRVIYPPPAAWEVLRRRAVEFPDGPVFRNSRGHAWQDKQVYTAFRRAARRVGIAGSPYHLRHGYATAALARGESPALVAELLGHSGLQTIRKYSHLSQHADALKEVAARLASREPPEGSQVLPPRA